MYFECEKKFQCTLKGTKLSTKICAKVTAANQTLMFMNKDTFCLINQLIVFSNKLSS